MNWPRFLRSLRRPPLRRFFLGQTVSLTGSWMQPVAQSWLLWRLTHSPSLLGWLVFLSQVPVFFLGLWGGAVADQLSRRRLLLAALGVAMAQAAALAVLTFTGTARPWHLLALASVLGVTFAFEVPARQALFADLAGEDLANAVALNSTLVTLMRVVGPSLGGLLVALAGEAWCFAFNAASYLAVLFALLSLKASPPSKRVKAAPVAEGLAFAAKEPRVRTLLLLLVVSSVFGVSYGTLLPVVASQVLGGGPALLGQLLGAAGAGALAGALTLLLREPAALERRVGLGASCLGLGILLLSLSRSTPLSLAALGLAGFGQITQTSGTLTLLQSLTPAALRGRLLGLFGTLFIGTTPYGALAAGSLAARFGAPTVLGVFSALVLVASLAFHLWRTRHPARAPSAPPAFPPQVP